MSLLDAAVLVFLMLIFEITAIVGTEQFIRSMGLTKACGSFAKVCWIVVVLQCLWLAFCWSHL